MAYRVSAITGVRIDVSQKELLARRLGVPIEEVKNYKGPIAGPESPRPMCMWNIHKQYEDAVFLDDIVSEQIQIARDIRDRIGLPPPQGISSYMSLYVGGSLAESDERFCGGSFTRQMLRDLAELIDDFDIDLNIYP